MTKPQPYIAEVMPSVRQIFSDLMQSLALEAYRFKVKAKQGGLTPTEIKNLELLAKSLERLSNEESKLDKKDLISQLSEDDKMKLLRGIIQTRPELLTGVDLKDEK